MEENPGNIDNTDKASEEDVSEGWTVLSQSPEPEKAKEAVFNEDKDDSDLYEEAEKKEEVKEEENEEETKPKEVVIPIKVSDKPAEVLYASPNGTLYPELPKEETSAPKVRKKLWFVLWVRNLLFAFK